MDMMRIEKYVCSELPPDLRQLLKKIALREFGQVPIVRAHIWAEPDWAIVGFVGAELVSYLNIVDRQASADGAPVHLFGLNNVITEPRHRGQGYSRQLNLYAIDLMAQLDPDACGFLFCSDEMLEFYQRLGWRHFKGQVTVSQPSGDKDWPSNAMLLDTTGRRDWKTVHLCGLPW
jgi:predicted GNAT family N-acyltransferase